MTGINPLHKSNNPLPNTDFNDVPEASKRLKNNGEVVVSYSGSSAHGKVGKEGVPLYAPVVQDGSTGNLEAKLASLMVAPKTLESVKDAFKSPAMDDQVGEAKRKYSFSSIEDFTIFLNSKLSDIKELQKNLNLEDIKRARLQGQEEMKANDEKLQASLKAGTEAKKSGLAARIFGWISSIAAIIVGAVMVATGVGAVAGALMIAGGVVGVVSCALQECAKAGLISKDAMAVLGPIMTALEVITAVASAVVSFGGSAVGLIAKKLTDLAPKIAQMAEKVASALNKVAEVGTKAADMVGRIGKFAQGLSKTVVPAGDLVVSAGNTITQTTSQGLSAHAAFKQADLMKSRADLDAQQAAMDKLTDALQHLLESFQTVFNALNKLLAERNNSQQNLTRNPRTI